MTKENSLFELKKVLEKFITPKNSWNPVEKALFTPYSFFTNYKKNQEMLLPAIKYSFNHHYKNNDLYKRLCEINNIKPDNIKTISDVTKIPLLPDSFFKDYPEGKGFLTWLDNVYTGSTPKPYFKTDIPTYDEVIEQFNQNGVSIMFTSGTSGRFSFIPRNSSSWDRLRYNAIRSFIELMDLNLNDSVILLIPDPRLTNLTIASLFGIAYDLYKPNNIHIALEKIKITTQLLRIQRAEAVGIREKIKEKAMSKISPIVQKKSDKRMINLLEKFEKEGKRVILAGPPFWLNRIMERMKKEGRTVNLPASQVLTGGGWKAENDKRNPEEAFRETVKRVLGIPDERYHDVYAMSECSSIFLSCQGHYKHIPPTILPYILDEELNPIGYNKYGRFAFIDPIPDSYPGFIITGDKVKLLEKCPVCKREGPVLDVEVYRLPGVEGRGCAAVMAELMQEEKK
jgi:phenylacetate-coenzyme A ligase PaaK-like adenylate-forming protein